MQRFIDTIMAGVSNWGVVGEVIIIILVAFVFSFLLAFIFWLSHIRSIKKRYK